MFERSPSQIAFCALLSLWFLLPQVANAQPVPGFDIEFGPRIIGRAMAVPAVPAAARAADDDEDPETKLIGDNFPGGAALKTDPEYQRLLKRAQQCVQDGRLDLAAVLWQKVLDEAGDTLMVTRVQTTAGSWPMVTYGSLAEHVERTLARLPPLALATYRTSADGEARALLAAAGSEGEEQALNEIVRRFFLSSLGDDAAYRLACIALDRHDFVGASRLLTKILERHPDPSVPRADILLRLAVAAAHMGDKATAEQAMQQFAAAAGARPPSDIVDLVLDNVRQTASQAHVVSSAASRDWHMKLGNPSRTGHMTGLPAAATSRTLSELWVHESPLGTLAQQGTPGGVPMAVVMGGGLGGFGGGVIMLEDGRVIAAGGGAAVRTSPPSIAREDLIKSWRDGGWRPTGRLLFDGGRVYIKTPERVVCFSTTAYTDQPEWQSLWSNRYEGDSSSQQAAMYRAMTMAAQSGKPSSLAEVLLFGDRVHQSMSIADGVLYTIEGRRVMEGEPAKPPAAGVRRGVQYGVVPRRTRGNWLTAYHAAGGKALWSRAAGDDDQEGNSDIGFVAAPVPCGNVLLAPVTDGGTMWLYGLDKASGDTVWKAYLCDEPQGGASNWAEIAIAVEGREAYLTVGCGVVFAVDAASGTIRWAVRYQRDGNANPMVRNVYGQQNLQLDLLGWDDDVVIPYGRQLVVLASDSNSVFAVDRRTGEFLWHSPRTTSGDPEASYCLGVHGSLLYLAGKNVVRCLNLRRDGAREWEREIDDSFGRGCLTSDALYMPVKDSILKLDLARGRELAQVGVALTNDEPAGNLFSDGEKLWVVGAGRIYAMTTLEHRLQLLAAEIAAGNPEAQLNRMRLHHKQERLDAALDDLRGAYALFQKQLSPDEAAQRLFAAMQELKLSQQRPVVALNLLTEHFITADSPPQLGKEAAARQSDLVSSAIAVARQRKPAGAVDAILAATPLMTQEHVVSNAAAAVDAAATKNDVAALLDALADGDAAARLISMRAAARLAPDDARPVVAKLLADRDDYVRLSAARTLANLGERKEVLETFISLLDSETIRIRTRSYQSLRALTGQTISFSPDGAHEERAIAAQQWKQWVSSSGASAKWNLPLAEQAVPLGRTLVVAQNRLVEYDAGLTEKRAEITLPGPAWGCQGLPNGNRLVAVYAHSMLVEYDEGGREVWNMRGLPGPPFSVQRLDNGNTLVACPHANQIAEITPAKTITAISMPGTPYSAQRLDTGTTLVALFGESRVVEIDREGRVVWEARTANPPSHAQRLENGNTLVVLQHGRKVVEYDPTGKQVVWETKSSVRLYNPNAAQRLPSGNTLVADQQGLKEIDATGQRVVKELKEQRMSNVTGVSSF